MQRAYYTYLEGEAHADPGDGGCGGGLNGAARQALHNVDRLEPVHDLLRGRRGLLRPSQADLGELFHLLPSFGVLATVVCSKGTAPVILELGR